MMALREMMTLRIMSRRVMPLRETRGRGQGVAAAATGLVLALAAHGCVGIGGERIRLEHEPLTEARAPANATLRLGTPAADAREDTSRIGRATITVFAITSGSVQTESPVTQEIATEVRSALEAGGYRVVDVHRGDPPAAAAPMVLITVEEFYFKNYNWLWPYVPTWGDIKLRLTLVDAAGRGVFEKSFEASGRSHCLQGHCAFSNATKSAMTKVLSEIVRETSTAEFRRALDAAAPSSGAGGSAAAVESRPAWPRPGPALPSSLALGRGAEPRQSW